MNCRHKGDFKETSIIDKETSYDNVVIYKFVPLLPRPAQPLVMNLWKNTARVRTSKCTGPTGGRAKLKIGGRSLVLVRKRTSPFESCVVEVMHV